MIQINVAQQLKSAIGTIRNYEVDDNVEIADSNCLIQGEVRLIRTNRSILIKVTLRTKIELPCSRCLTEFKCPLTLNIEEEYFPIIDIVTGAPIPLPDEPDCFTIDEHNILDLSEAIRQYALLAIPMKPLCREDCAGLCPTCGCNLNQVSCNCPTKIADPRWSVLSKLKLAESINERKGTR
ncbi:MAG: DUF177 domain-containing protein [Chloroflexota bacterium]